MDFSGLFLRDQPDRDVLEADKILGQVALDALLQRLAIEVLPMTTGVFTNSVTTELPATAVPEPASLALPGSGRLGLAGVGFVRRRRSH